jgi:hypothetical protein
MPSARAEGSSKRQNAAAHSDLAGMEARKDMESTTPPLLTQKPSTAAAPLVS